MIDVLRTVAGKVEAGVAGSVLGEFVGPEFPVGVALVDPVVVHVAE